MGCWRLLIPMAGEAVHCCPVGVVDHSPHEFSIFFQWIRIAGQAGCVMTGLAVVIMGGQDIRPAQDGVAIFAILK